MKLGKKNSELHTVSYTYDSMDEREEHVVNMEARGWECTGQIREQMGLNGPIVPYAQFVVRGELSAAKMADLGIPRIITLCGSTRFKEDFERVNAELTMQGHIVLSVGVFGHQEGVELSDEDKNRLDELHRDKIDMSSGIYVINRSGYIGESTRGEIEYTVRQGKTITYLEPIE